MELKPYQSQALNDLSSFLGYYSFSGNPAESFSHFWMNHPRTPLDLMQIPRYSENIKGVPHVCLKVPTAGGKTFIACNALKSIFDHMLAGKPKVVVWLVPSTSILEQTIQCLSNPHHPYRQKIDTYFNGRVEIYTKEQVLMGTNFSPTTVKEHLSIIVGSFSSFKKTSNKDSRKVYQENSSLAEFPKTYTDQASLVGETDETALIQVINQLNPVVIVDESHNAESDLSVDMLQNLNPSLILDLTATPRKNSNIINYTDAWELKKENMVKLPVIVYNHHDVTDVITSSIQLRRSLEEKAIEEERNGGKYIRPIILFQAQSKNVQDAETFERLKEKLIKAGIPKEQVAIKTAEINEIKGLDLASKDCPIRYIITINALKEGWDCPFAYILATLANRSSAVDVEQILGRILRQPHVKKHNEPLLNLSYVFTSSAQFKDTLDNIVKGLNKSGFSKKDYRVASELDEVPSSETVKTELGLTENTPLELLFDETEVKIATTETTPSESVKSIEKRALEETASFEEALSVQENNPQIPADLWDKVKRYEIKAVFKESARSITLPQFYIPKAKSLLDEYDDALIEKSTDLIEDFDLKTQNTQISFETVDADIYQVDITKDHGSPEYSTVKAATKNYILQYIEGLPEEKQLEKLAGLILDETRKIDAIADSDLRKFIQRVIESLTPDQISDLKQNPYKYGAKIRARIIQLMSEHAEKKFYQWLDTDKIKLKPSFKWPDFITPTETKSSIVKSLYEEESSDMNSPEWELINRLANAENTEFWHRNMVGKGFSINGGFLNQYPDFFVKTKKGNMVLVESKGDDRTNQDSKDKIKLGNRWANMAGSNYKYFMVFDKESLEGAYSLDEFLEIYKDL